MEYLENIHIRNGYVKTIEGQEYRIGDTLKYQPADRIEEIEKGTLIKAFGTARKKFGVIHAVVFEGYLYNMRDMVYFFIKGATSFNPGCSKIMDSPFTRLHSPQSKITCTRCLKRIQVGHV